MKRAPVNKGRPQDRTTPGNLFGSTPESRVLRALRFERGLSQSALARAMGSHKSVLSRIERGASLPSLDYVARLVEFFGPDWDKTVERDARATRDKQRHGLVGRAEAMIVDMAKSAAQHRVTSVMAPDGRCAVICVAMVNDSAAEALMMRALQTAAACVEEGDHER